MYLELSCACGAAFTTDNDSMNLTLLWANRFIEAHKDCGFMSPQYFEQQEQISKRFNIAPNKPVEDL